MSDAHEQIRNCLAIYCELVDAGDLPGLADLFTDATLADERGHIFVTGAEEMRAQWERQTILYDGSPRTKHIVADIVIEVNEDKGTATSRSSYVVFQSLPDFPLQPIITGRYRDVFRRHDDGVWRFKQRAYLIDQRGDLSRHMQPHVV